MKKILIIASCSIIIVSCKKDTGTVPEVESSNQKLIKLTKTSYLASGPYSEYLNFEYNSAGKIIAEGNKKYLRDDKQRIIQVHQFTTQQIADEYTLQVHYSDATSGKVSYTNHIRTDMPLKAPTDSIAYIHDAKGRLTKLMHYYLNYLTAGAPPALVQYHTIEYDNNGNILSLNRYAIPNTGTLVHCEEYIFDRYDSKTNPMHTEDEVRLLELNWGGTFNVSLNNSMLANNSKRSFINVNDIYGKVYDYRADGRPRSCNVLLNGADAFTLIFTYQ
jgi:hypothetical protein